MAPLPNTFHPYERPAIDYITVQVTRDSSGSVIVNIEDTDGGTTQSRRVVRLNKLLRLEARWTSRFRRYVIGSLLENMVGQVRRTVSRHPDPGTLDLEEEVTSYLQEVAEQFTERIRKQPYHVIGDRYLHYVLADSKELAYHRELLEQALVEATTNPAK